MAELLLKARAGIHVKDHKVHELHNTAANAMCCVLSAPIPNKWTVGLMCVQGFTPLTMAAMHGNIDVAQLLVYSGANVNTQDSVVHP